MFRLGRNLPEGDSSPYHAAKSLRRWLPPLEGGPGATPEFGGQDAGFPESRRPRTVLPHRDGRNSHHVPNDLLPRSRVRPRHPRGDPLRRQWGPGSGRRSRHFRGFGGGTRRPWESKRNRGDRCHRDGCNPRVHQPHELGHRDHDPGWPGHERHPSGGDPGGHGGRDFHGAHSGFPQRMG